MSALQQAIHENSERFLPAFARIGQSSGGVKVYRDLDFRYTDKGPKPNEDERELARWVTVAGCAFTVTDSGEPMDPASGATNGRLIPMFEGGAEFLLTDRRLMALVIEADTVVGKVGGRSGHVLAVSFPLERIESVTIDIKKKTFGGFKDGRMHIMSINSGVADLFIDDVIAVPGGNSAGYQRFRGTKREIVEAFVAPVCAAREANANQADQSQLAQARGGERESSPTEFGVSFVAATTG